MPDPLLLPMLRPGHPLRGNPSVLEPNQGAWMGGLPEMAGPSNQGLIGKGARRQGALMRQLLRGMSRRRSILGAFGEDDLLSQPSLLGI